ncbi:MAG: tetratricopeptide repeat protein [Pseudomonadota bacterium]
MRFVRPSLQRFIAALLCATVMATQAAPITPSRDDEVIETLPAVTGSRAEARRVRQQLAQTPRDATLALAVAKRHLDQAHALGDPRFAGMAMSAIAPWRDDATQPDDVLLMRANLQQYLHEFDAAAASLQRLLARPGPPRPQAWLTLATVRRVQGRYADSDNACRQVASAGSALHANACLAENLALRGDVDRARATFNSLLADARQPNATRAWLGTSLAELEQRAGRAAAAEAAFQAALKLEPDPYTALAYADFLIDDRRPAQALTVLSGRARSDAVLLRLAIAGTQARAASAAADVAEMRARIALANERPDAKLFHGREQAMFALAVDRDAASALELARGNVAHQREPLDLFVLAQAARASGQPAAIDAAKRLASEIGLVDQRIKAIL